MRHLALMTTASLLLGILVTPAISAAPNVPIAVIVHPSNKMNDISVGELAAIFMRKRRNWSSGDRIMFLNRQAGSPVRVAFDKTVLQMSSTEVANYWIDQRIRGQGQPPWSVPSTVLVQRIVATQKAAIGYIGLDEVTKDVKVLRVGGLLPRQKGYPIVLKESREE